MTLRARGHVLMLLMAFLAASIFALAILTTRLGLNIQARRASDRRTQALWLARSAISAGVTGAHTVPTRFGPATVRVEKNKGAVVVTVQLADGRAEVTQGSAGPWQESYSPEP